MKSGATSNVRSTFWSVRPTMRRSSDGRNTRSGSAGPACSIRWLFLTRWRQLVHRNPISFRALHCARNAGEMVLVMPTLISSISQFFLINTSRRFSFSLSLALWLWSWLNNLIGKRFQCGFPCRDFVELLFPFILNYPETLFMKHALVIVLP